jgi:hypothetical protein
MQRWGNPGGCPISKRGEESDEGPTEDIEDMDRAGVVGPITVWNSVRGAAAGGGNWMVWDYDAIHDQLVVGRPSDNIVTLFRPVYPVFLPVVMKR